MTQLSKAVKAHKERSLIDLNAMLSETERAAINLGQDAVTFDKARHRSKMGKQYPEMKQK